MNLALNITEHYKSNSQIARVVTEAWVRENLYCPNCGGSFELYAANTKSKDAKCSKCGEEFQIKSGKGKIGNKILGAEFNTTILNLEKGENPSFILLQYSIRSWSVVNVQFIHRAFITVSCVIPRKKLGPKARRAGWQGCNYDLTLVPVSARISVIDNERIEPPAHVFAQWRAAQPLLKLKPSNRRWTADILRIVESLPLEFDLQQMYRFVPQLQKTYPNNHHIQAKIRQQLQILRNMGKIEFLSLGKYHRVVN